MKISPLFLIPPLLFAGLAVAFYMGLTRDDPDNIPSALLGRAAPPVQVQPFAAEPMPTDEDLKAGDVTLVNFWASWCAPCRVEHPHLQALADAGFTIHGINHKDELANAAGFLQELGNPFATLGRDSGRMAIDWGVYGLPETFVLDGEGRVRMRFAGPITPSVMENTILPALREAGAVVPEGLVPPRAGNAAIR
ncbi:MAG: DsbE family thiol:disulfide interchange protein [Rhodobacteraceae bacterium]|nr:DsbE family thiol:disulfide interchange protein [Paracoccaceae bacterium]